MNLPIQRLSPAYYEGIERQIEKAFYEILFAPLVAVLRQHYSERKKVRLEAFNAVGLLAAALRSGRVRYEDGVFSGELNAALGKELRSLGASYDAIRKVYRLQKTLAPSWLLQDAAIGAAADQLIHEQIGRAIDSVEASLAVRVNDNMIDAGDAVKKIVKGFAPMAKTIQQFQVVPQVGPDLTRESWQGLAQTYRDSLTPHIQDFSQEEIGRLRAAVSRNALKGQRSDNLVAAIRNRYDVSRTKAKFLARQETQLFMSSYQEAKYAEAGVQEYVWQSAGDSRVRPEHRKLNGKTFRFDDPPMVEGQPLNPGQDFNCFPEDSRIDFAYGIKKAFRRWYDGELTTIITASGKTIRATPNHPVLTLCGWKPIGLLDENDYVIDATHQLRKAAKSNSDERIATIGEIFESLGETFFRGISPGQSEQFHGDGSNGNVDVVFTARPLGIDRQAEFLKSGQEFRFSESLSLAPFLSQLFKHDLAFPGRKIGSHGMRRGSQSLLFVNCQTSHADKICLRDIADCNSILKKSPANDYTANPGALGYGEFAFAGNIGIYDRLGVQLESIVRYPFLGPTFNILDSVRVIHKWKSPFKGYVFNLETLYHNYTTDGVVVSNCRCVARPVIKTAALRRAA